jgi:hypothetical protein
MDGMRPAVVRYTVNDNNARNANVSAMALQLSAPGSDTGVTSTLMSRR